MTSKALLARLVIAALMVAALLFAGLACLNAEVYGAPAKLAEASQARVTSVALPTVASVVTVTNTSDVVNGDTTSIESLLGHPGPDGVSFREALSAANGTAGPKQLRFASSLSGGRIVFSAQGALLTLSSGELTIDGDIDHDGRPDVTLAGSAHPLNPPMPGLIIDSSHNTITGLAFADFSGGAIFMACLRAGCAPKLFTDNRIISNTLSTSRGTAPLIGLSPIGILPLAELPAAAGLLWQDLVIAGNTITSTAPNLWQAVTINPAIGGASGNRISGLTITDNRIVGGWLGVIASGQGSDSFGVPGTPHYSDDNIIEHVQIAGNVIRPGTTGAGAALYLNAAAGGGTRNVLSDVMVAQNRLLPDVSTGLDVIAADANSGYFGAPAPIKYTDGNRIEDLVIQDNIIEAPGGIGMNIMPANFGNRYNELRRVKITGNTIANCQGAGINVVAGNGGLGGPGWGDRSTRNNRVAGLEVNGVESKPRRWLGRKRA